MTRRRYVIEIRGGTGAGKSTLIRDLVHDAVHLSISDHLWVGLLHGTRLAVPGSYAMATGGLENRYSLQQCRHLIEQARQAAPVVVFEGGFLSKTTGEVYRWLRDEVGSAYRIILLAPPMSRVYANMAQRRQHGLSTRNKERIRADHLAVERAVTRIIADGKLVSRCRTYDEANQHVRRLIKELA